MRLAVRLLRRRRPTPRLLRCCGVHAVPPPTTTTTATVLLQRVQGAGSAHAAREELVHAVSREGMEADTASLQELAARICRDTAALSIHAADAAGHPRQQQQQQHQSTRSWMEHLQAELYRDLSSKDYARLLTSVLHRVADASAAPFEDGLAVVLLAQYEMRQRKRFVPSGMYLTLLKMAQTPAQLKRVVQLLGELKSSTMGHGMAMQLLKQVHRIDVEHSAGIHDKATLLHIARVLCTKARHDFAQQYVEYIRETRADVQPDAVREVDAIAARHAIWRYQPPAPAPAPPLPMDDASAESRAPDHVAAPTAAAVQQQQREQQQQRQRWRKDVRRLAALLRAGDQEQEHEKGEDTIGGPPPDDVAWEMLAILSSAPQLGTHTTLFADAVVKHFPWIDSRVCADWLLLALSSTKPTPQVTPAHSFRDLSGAVPPLVHALCALSTADADVCCSQPDSPEAAVARVWVLAMLLRSGEPDAATHLLQQWSTRVEDSCTLHEEHRVASALASALSGDQQAATDLGNTPDNWMLSWLARARNSSRRPIVAREEGGVSTQAQGQAQEKKGRRQEQQETEEEQRQEENGAWDPWGEVGRMREATGCDPDMAAFKAMLLSLARDGRVAHMHGGFAVMRALGLSLHGDADLTNLLMLGVLQQQQQQQQGGHSGAGSKRGADTLHRLFMGGSGSGSGSGNGSGAAIVPTSVNAVSGLLTVQALSAAGLWRVVRPLLTELSVDMTDTALPVQLPAEDALFGWTLLVGDMARAGRVESVHKTLSEMGAVGMPVSAWHCHMVVRALCERGEWASALNAVREMQGRGILSHAAFFTREKEHIFLRWMQKEHADVHAMLLQPLEPALLPRLPPCLRAPTFASAATTASGGARGVSALMMSGDVYAKMVQRTLHSALQSRFSVQNL